VSCKITELILIFFMNDLVIAAINTVNISVNAYCKFIEPNDTKATKANQYGYCISKNAWSLIFDEPEAKGSIIDHFVKIKWQDNFETDSRFVYYGKETRNECRLTRFGRGFPFRSEDNVGDLLIICRMDKDEYSNYILSTDEDIEDFLAAFNISPEQTNQLIDKKCSYKSEAGIEELFGKFIDRYADFPLTIEMAEYARVCFAKALGKTDELIKGNYDEALLGWIDTEYKLFKAFEMKCYKDRLKEPFLNMDELLAFSNTILNRRKSRAGKSLEYHLAHIFTSAGLRFETQVVTEGKKKPDFIFPGSKEYHNINFPKDKLICLGAKTTCKDRWRQILNEANEVKVKHLFTLQRGISKNQLSEMQQENVRLIVPASYLQYFDEKYRSEIMTLSAFNSFVREKQN
ncbi:type II restriction endonuclease, partial [Odoribacter laneus]